jgi:hypothetical protein
MTVRMGHAVFEPPITQSDGMDQCIPRFEAGALQPSHFARHAWAVIVEDRGLDAAQRSEAAFFCRRVAKIVKNLPALLRHLVERTGSRPTNADPLVRSNFQLCQLQVSTHPGPIVPSLSG